MLDSNLSRSPEFRNVPGFPGLVASTEGRAGFVTDGEFKERTGWLNHAGYLTLRVKDDCGKKKDLCLHRAVLLAFVGPLPKGKVSRHLDGVKTNNHPSNLAYGTHQENREDAIRHGTMASNPKPLRRNHGHSITRIRSAIALLRHVASGEYPQSALGVAIEALETTERCLVRISDPSQPK